MTKLFGCFFVLLFGFILLLVGLFRSFYNSFANVFRPQSQRPDAQARAQQPHTDTSSRRRSSTASGNAHREAGGYGSQQSGKIFAHDEGEYVDFEEVPKDTK